LIRTFTRINHQIRVSEVRVIDYDGSQAGVMSTSAALQLAHQRNLDLIEVAPNAVPPVCRVTDFGKYKYEMEKKEKQSRQHTSHTKVKEIKFHSNVDDHDYATKLRHIKDFLGDGHRVKVSLMFRGREAAHQELGYQVMHRVIKDIQEIGTAERNPEQMGRILYMMLTPRPVNRPVAQPADQPAAAPPP
jgi:translation initiation factor IF-3